MDNFIKIGGERKILLDHDVVMWIVGSMHPFNLVEDPGLSKLISDLSNNKYQLPSRKKVTSMVPELYMLVEKQVVRWMV